MGDTMEPYKPIFNPGAWEKRMLAEHPGWVEKHPQRLMNARAFDQRLLGTPASREGVEVGTVGAATGPDLL